MCITTVIPSINAVQTQNKKHAQSIHITWRRNHEGFRNCCLTWLVFFNHNIHMEVFCYSELVFIIILIKPETALLVTISIRNPHHPNPPVSIFELINPFGRTMLTTDGRHSALLSSLAASNFWRKGMLACLQTPRLWPASTLILVLGLSEMTLRSICKCVSFTRKIHVYFAKEQQFLCSL